MADGQRPPLPAGGGLLLVDKTAGRTSHDVVARVRRLLGTRRVGHAGTLDPMATGLLVLGVDRATKLLGHLALTDKTYLATIRLGVATTTDDAEGEIVATADPGAVAAVGDDRIAAGLRDLTGELRQVPAAVSAIKVDGVRAYRRVRDGETVELAARAVTVARFELVRPPRRQAAASGAVSSGTGTGGVLDLDVVVDCGTGTYVRSLARDLGVALGVGGHLTSLRRTRVGPFDVADAIDVADAGDVADAARLARDRLIPAQRAVAASFAARTVDARTADDVRHGRPIPPAGLPGTYAVFDESGTWLALVADRDGAARTVLGWMAG